MIYLTDTIPTYCPGCGKETNGGTWDRYGRDDWEAGCTHTCCGCGAMYQRVPTVGLIEAADKHGDLRQYAEEATP